MNKPSKTPGICRIDQPAHNTHGFFLRAARQGEIFSGFFSDKQYGGRAEALAAAAEYRGKLLKILGLPIHKSRRSERGDCAAHGPVGHLRGAAGD